MLPYGTWLPPVITTVFPKTLGGAWGCLCKLLPSAVPRSVTTAVLAETSLVAL